MNLEKLISKYIDGELSESEDQNLRQMIANEPNAKEIFDRAVNINWLLKEDSMAIETPQELRDETLVLINSMLHQENHKMNDFKSRRVRNYLKAVPVFLLLLLIYTINEEKQFYDYANNETIINTITDVQNSNVLNDNNNDNLSTNRDEKTGLTKIYPTTEKSSETLQEAKSVLDKSVANDEPLIIAENNEEIAQSHTIQKEEIILTEHIEEQSNNTNENQTNYLNTPLIVIGKTDNHSTSNNSEIDFKFETSQNYDVSLNSFISTELFTSEKYNDAKVLASISQSIAYSINKKERMGIELGYREFNYQEKFFVNVPISSLPENTQVEILNPATELYFTYVSSMEHTKKLIWGAAFYESTLLSSRNFSLDARVGIGSSNDGALIYSRLFSKYEILSGLSLTFGCSGMLYQSALDNFQNEIHSSLSLTYGLQFKF